MSHTQLAYLVFSIVIVLALIFDLGLLSKRNATIGMRKALTQTIFWVGLSVLFCAFLWWDEGASTAIKFFTAYLMEWSLSIDNIFVFILIFSFFKVPRNVEGRALIVGILLAIVFRVIFIALGVELINRFHWLLYVFGAFLLYTGFKLFFKNDEEEFNPGETKVYRWITQLFRVTDVEPRGRYMIRLHGKVFFTQLAVVVVMLAATDVVFALDSIPTVVSLVREGPKVPFSDADVLVIYSSNIFAVLGLRSLFFLLKGAVSKFDYLQQGIAVVLAFIGAKMLVEYFGIHIPIYISLAVIVICLAGSIIYSIYHARPGVPAEKFESNKI
jgi:tellurite resistance protein TerC